MFFVFGWEKTFKPAESLLRTHCHNCNKDTPWRVWRETEWVSLFFVRLLPFLTKYHLACDSCRDALAVDTELLRMARARHRLSDERSGHLHDEIVKRIQDRQLGGLTEGQRRYYQNVRDGGRGGSGAP